MVGLGGKKETLKSEFIEVKYPGVICGKEVVDARMKRVGLVNSINIKFPEFSIELLIRGYDKDGNDLELPVSSDHVRAMNDVIFLDIELKEFNALDINSVLGLRRLIGAENREKICE